MGHNGLGMSFQIGCAIWAYKGWLGTFFPTGTAPAKFLQAYSQRFITVEVNATFYSTPSPAVVQRWVQETPDGFQFCPKFPRSITHEGLLLPRVEAAKAFITLMQGLQVGQDPRTDRLGPLLLQLPPRYGPQFFADLESFLGQLQALPVRIAVEVRHRQWFTPPHATRLNALLEQLSVGRVLLDTRPIYAGPDDPQLHSERKKPKLPLQPIATAPFCVIRYISHPDRQFNESFIRTWIPYLSQWIDQGKQVYLFVHCPIEEHSPDNAVFLNELLLAEGLPIPPLHWTLQPEPPQQLSLFE
jgi:uncharacterized protein YecE (DUF72 family)